MGGSSPVCPGQTRQITLLFEGVKRYIQHTSHNRECISPVRLELLDNRPGPPEGEISHSPWFHRPRVFYICFPPVQAETPLEVLQTSLFPYIANDISCQLRIE